ncbi:MAG: hypothetical protein AAGE65_08595 [Planctomycetota bacterium]
MTHRFAATTAITVFLFLAIACKGGDGNSFLGDGVGGPGLKVDVHTFKTRPVRIENPHRVPVNVIYNNQRIGWLRPYAYTNVQLPVGLHTVTFVDGYGNVIGEQTVSNED